MKLPVKMYDLVNELCGNGWTFIVQHGEDTGDNPFVSIEARKPERRTLRLTWHTRATGTYRLFSCVSGKRDITLTQAMMEVKQ